MSYEIQKGIQRNYSNVICKWLRRERMSVLSMYDESSKDYLFVC